MAPWPASPYLPSLQVWLTRLPTLIGLSTILASVLPPSGSKIHMTGAMLTPCDQETERSVPFPEPTKLFFSHQARTTRLQSKMGIKHSIVLTKQLWTVPGLQRLHSLPSIILVLLSWNNVGGEGPLGKLSRVPSIFTLVNCLQPFVYFYKYLDKN